MKILGKNVNCITKGTLGFEQKKFFLPPFYIYHLDISLILHIMIKISLKKTRIKIHLTYLAGGCVVFYHSI